MSFVQKGRQKTNAQYAFSILAPAQQKSDAPIEDIEDVVLSSAEEKKRAENWKKLDKTRGFMKYKRQTDPYRDPVKRVKDWSEIRKPLKVRVLLWLRCDP